MIGAYGRSLGGIVTSHLTDKVDMVIVDRTFANFHDLADRKFYGSISRWFFWLSSCGWYANNDVDFISKSNKCYKVLAVEKADEVVELQATLLVGVSKLIRKNKKMPITNEEIDQLNSASALLINLEHDLYTVILNYYEM